MSEQLSMGKCHLCGGSFSRTAMTRHLSGCIKPDAPPPTKVAGDPKLGHSLHVFVEGRWATGYWMHLAVPEQAPLDDLDRFLRRTWLECCGHMSAFTICGDRYASQPIREYGDKGMGVRINRILEVGLKFSHEYDYGSTTELRLKVIARRQLAVTSGDVKLLAQNVAPVVQCQRCTEQLATQICTQCIESGKEGWLCKACASAHDCGTEMCLPVVNSPRVGVCGYCA